MSGVTLKGMTWSHPRGYDPLVACSAIWADRTGVEISWDKRSLQDFESYSVESLAARYDLIIIDHPHVGQITAENCLIPLDTPGYESSLAELEDGSVGGSFKSYRWDERQWALPVDAAAQVQAWRPDLITAPAKTWDEVIALAQDDRVLCPLRPPHSLMVFYTLAGNLGTPCANAGPGDLIALADGRPVLDLMRQLFRAIEPACLTMDPIDVFERMTKSSSTIACAPLIYGYVCYALDGFRDERLAFGDIPAAGTNGPTGSAIGGTGIAVSVRTAHRREAIDFAYWVASGDIQRGPYAEAGGQPGHAEAWEDANVNAAPHEFYKNTRTTLEGGWIRPRHDGYVGFQQEAAEIINRFLDEDGDGDLAVTDLNTAYRGSFSELHQS